MHLPGATFDVRTFGAHAGGKTADRDAINEDIVDGQRDRRSAAASHQISEQVGPRLGFILRRDGIEVPARKSGTIRIAPPKRCSSCAFARAAQSRTVLF